MVEKMALKESREAGRVIRRQIDIFVHMEDVDFAPVDAGRLPQRFQESELRVACRQDHVGMTALLNRLLQEGGCICRGGLAGAGIAVVNTYRQNIDGRCKDWAG